MIIAITGRDGVGKSTFAACLGHMVAQHKTTVVVDTDLWQPTLPAHYAGPLRNENSLGKYIMAVGPVEVLKFLHQHPDDKYLFYAGTVPEDNYLSCAINDQMRRTTPKIEQMRTQQAVNFIVGCAKEVDNVIIDCSGQHDDYFLEAAFRQADALISLVSPDLMGAYWLQSMECVFAQISRFGFTGQHIVVATKTSQINDINALNTLINPYSINYTLPYGDEVEYMALSRSIKQQPKTKTGKAYFSVVKTILKSLRQNGE
jgi:MinD-like ATPase involved in chromosome partitioning or flagellar assembly